MKVLAFCVDDLFVNRLVETGYLEVHMNGNSTSRAVDTENECLILGSLRDLAFWSCSNYNNNKKKLLTVVRDQFP